MPVSGRTTDTSWSATAIRSADDGGTVVTFVGFAATVALRVAPGTVVANSSKDSALGFTVGDAVDGARVATDVVDPDADPLASV